MSDNQMPEGLYVFSICLIFGTIMFIFAAKYISAAYKARAQAASADAYRDLAERAAAAQAENAASLVSIQAAVTDIRARVAAVEKILKEVE